MNLKEIQLSNDIANLLYDFLPANPHPYADKSISFPGCAAKLGLQQFWVGGSKRPAVSQLVSKTLEFKRDKFCSLVLEIVKTAILYKSTKEAPVNRQQIEELNRKIIEVGFKIPELWDPSFLKSLPSGKPSSSVMVSIAEDDIKKLKQEYIALANLEPQNRGYVFQKFLNDLFSVNNLSPKTAFRITGEEIDGSFEMGNDIYLVEAKWQASQISEKDLLIFRGKIEGKSTWSRGLFISYSGYTKQGLEAFAKGKPTNMIGMDGQDLFFILDGRLSLTEAIRKKARLAAETNEFFVSVYELANYY